MRRIADFTKSEFFTRHGLTPEFASKAKMSEGEDWEVLASMCEASQKKDPDGLFKFQFVAGAGGSVGWFVVMMVSSSWSRHAALPCCRAASLTH